MTPRRVACHKCRETWTIETPLGRRDECPHCRADAKVCLNCRLYDRGAHHECREEQAEWVKEKAQGNFCSYFEPKASAGEADREVSAARAKLDGLFKGAKDEPASKPAASLSDELARFLASKKP